jgi:plastocyanin
MSGNRPNARPVRGHRPLVLPALIGLLVAGCGSAASSRTKTPSGQSSASRRITIVLRDYAYHPANVAVPAGSAVTFTNRDSTAHTASSSSAPSAFDTGTMNPGQSKTIIFRTPGTYPYYCQFHAFMHGTIAVTR